MMEAWKFFYRWVISISKNAEKMNWFDKRVLELYWFKDFFVDCVDFRAFFLKFSNLVFSPIFFSKSGVTYGYLDNLQINTYNFLYMMHVPKMTPYAPKMLLKLAILSNLKSTFFGTWPIARKQGVRQQKVLKDLWSVCLGLPMVKIWGQSVMPFQS